MLKSKSSGERSASVPRMDDGGGNGRKWKDANGKKKKRGLNVKEHPQSFYRISLPTKDTFCVFFFPPDAGDYFLCATDLAHLAGITPINCPLSVTVKEACQV